MNITFSFDNFDMLGVFENDVYLRGSTYEDDEGFKDAIVCISPELLKQALDAWIKEKKDICTRYGHFCGVMGSVMSIESESMKSMDLTWYDRENPDGIKKETPVYRMKTFDPIMDMEHG